MKLWCTGSIWADIREGKCGSTILENEGTGVCGENLEEDLRGEYLPMSVKLNCAEEWR
jgi:hypothetical protein